MQESTLEAGRERDEALQQLDAAGQELAATRQQLQQAQAWPLLAAAAWRHPEHCTCSFAWAVARACCLLLSRFSVATFGIC